MRPRGLALLLVAASACARKEPDERPNVLLISLDSVRRDLVHVYGEPPPGSSSLTPSSHIDRLAAEGLLVDDAYATSSWTLPSHATLLTGVPELVHAVELDGHRLPRSLPTLAELLRDAGYRTAGVYSGPYLDPRFGFGRGFESYSAAYGPELARAVAQAETAREGLESLADGSAAERRAALDANGTAQATLELVSHRDRSSARIAELVQAELARAAEDERPFFLFVHAFDPHYDYVPPSPFDRLFDPDYTGSLDGQDFFFDPAVAEFDESTPTGRRRVASERDVRHLRALQAGELASIDGEIGRILEDLEARGLARDTLVIVTADHGDEFFEHGSIGHRQTLFDEVVRVPLVLRWPQKIPAGSELEGPTALTDVVPTVLQAAGIAPPAHLRSRSLLPPLEREESGVLGRLVRTQETELRASLDGVDLPVRGVLIRVIETYRLGAIKLTRERSWTRPAEPVVPAVAAVLERASRERFEKEQLSWIDVELHPDEGEEDRSQVFDDPRARAALEAFRARYRDLSQLRAVAEPSDGTEELLALLRGLGYASDAASYGVLPSDELNLPPPGEAILRVER